MPSYISLLSVWSPLWPLTLDLSGHNILTEGYRAHVPRWEILLLLQTTITVSQYLLWQKWFNVCPDKKHNLWTINDKESFFFSPRCFEVLPLVALAEFFHNAQRSPGDSNLKSILIDLIFNPLWSSATTNRKHSVQNIAAGHCKLLSQQTEERKAWFVSAATHKIHLLVNAEQDNTCGKWCPCLSTHRSSSE